MGHTTKPELRALTSVRGIAAWLVVLFHMRPWLGSAGDSISSIADHGYLAVDFFFILSGFVIWLTYSERLRSGGISAFPEFLKRRIARIWPLHAFILICWAALVLACAVAGRPLAGNFALDRFALQLLLVHNWGLTSDLSWNTPSWSISAELLAYICFPLIAFMVDWRKVAPAIAIAAICALAAVLYLFCLYRGFDTLLPSIPKLGVIRCLAEFSIGTAVCGLWLRWREAWRMAALISGTIAAVMLALWLLGAAPEPIAIPLAFAVSVLAFALTSGKAGNILEVGPLHYLGEISYATYLSHMLITALFETLVRIGPQPWPIIVAYGAIVLIASSALYHGVERPAQRWINALRLPLPDARPTRLRTPR